MADRLCGRLQSGIGGFDTLGRNFPSWLNLYGQLASTSIVHHTIYNHTVRCIEGYQKLLFNYATHPELAGYFEYGIRHQIGSIVEKGDVALVKEGEKMET